MDRDFWRPSSDFPMCSLAHVWLYVHTQAQAHGHRHMGTHRHIEEHTHGHTGTHTWAHTHGHTQLGTQAHLLFKQERRRLFLETESHYVAHTGRELPFLLPGPQALDYRCEQPHRTLSTSHWLAKQPWQPGELRLGCGHKHTQPLARPPAWPHKGFFIL